MLGHSWSMVENVKRKRRLHILGNYFCPRWCEHLPELPGSPEFRNSLQNGNEAVDPSQEPRQEKQKRNSLRYAWFQWEIFLSFRNLSLFSNGPCHLAKKRETKNQHEYVKRWRLLELQKNKQNNRLPHWEPSLPSSETSLWKENQLCPLWWLSPRNFYLKVKVNAFTNPPGSFLLSQGLQSSLMSEY